VRDSVVQRFSAERMVEDYLRLYEQLVPMGSQRKELHPDSHPSASLKKTSHRETYEV
jgi:hypothetical protein